MLVCANLYLCMSWRAPTMAAKVLIQAGDRCLATSEAREVVGMTRDRLGPLSVLAMAAVLMAAPSTAAQIAVPVPGDGRPVRPGGPWVIELTELPDAAEGRLAFFLGTTDVTGLLRRDQRGRYTYAAKPQPLPPGQHELVVYLVRDPTSWEELARIPVRVLTAGGYEEAEWQPRVELNQKSQYDEGIHGDASPSARPTFNDLAGQAGLVTRHQRGDLEIRTSWNIVGSTFGQEALRFGERGPDAPKVDLSDYLVDLHYGRQQVSLGHVSFGNQPLLLAGLNNRGLSYSLRPNQRLEIGASAQNAQRIVGYDQMFGISSSDNYIAAMTLGYDLLANRPGGLRVDVLVLDAEVLSQLDFNTGQVPDAERNQGYGIRLSGSSAGGRLRASLDYARSRYTNPDDPFLSQGVDLVPVRETTNDARTLDLSFDLLKDKHVLGDVGMSMTLGFRHDRTDPLYKSVGASVAADLESNALSLSGMVGQLSINLQHGRSEDNLDDIPTILKTKTESTNASVSLPLQSMMSNDDNPHWWWPQNMSHSYGYTHQYGANLPPSFDPASHIPDQVTENHNLAVSWAFGVASFSYNFSLGDQDNRQPGRVRADFRNTGHGLNLGLPIGAAVTFNLGANFADAEDVEQAITRTTDSYSFGVDWHITDKLNLRGNYGWTQTDDSRNTATSEAYTLDTDLSWRFELAGFASRKLPGQLFIRHSAQRNESVDNVFDLASLGRSWTLTGGFSIGLR